MMSTRVFLVEDHAFTRDGLRAALSAHDFRVVGEAASAEDAVPQILACPPDVVVMDLGLPGMDGVSATRALKEALPELRVVVLTVQRSQSRVRAALASGAEAYCIKDGDPRSLILAVQAARLGSIYLDPAVAQALLAQVEPGPPLSERETEILQLIAQGMSNKEIGRQLNLSPSTVKTHIEHLLGKLAANDRTEAAIKAYRQGLI